MDQSAPLSDPAPATPLQPVAGSEAPSAPAETKVFVVGNEKGGSGKTTAAMHLITALLRKGFKTGAIDLDLRQKSLSRYLENRALWALKNEIPPEHLPMPKLVAVPNITHDSRKKAAQLELEALQAALSEFQGFDYVVIDCPGANTRLSRLAHAHADTIVTPMNDSFVDFDLLARVDPETFEIEKPSFYSEMVWGARRERARHGHQDTIDWIVMRNRIGANANNKKRMGEKLDLLAERIGFRQVRGFGERVIFRELFLQGLTLLDLGKPGIPKRITSMSHVSAKQEIRALLAALNLPAKPVVSTA